MAEIKDSKIAEIAIDRKLNGVSNTQLSAGHYIGQKSSVVSDMFIRKGKGDKFARPVDLDNIPEGMDLLIFAQVTIIGKDGDKLTRISVPVDYLTWKKGSYFTFRVNSEGFANFTDATITKAQVEQILADQIPA